MRSSIERERERERERVAERHFKMFRGVERMSLIASILYPVDFSSSCVAMAAYVKRAATLLGARVSLVHVVDPAGYNGMQLFIRPISEVAEEYLGIGRERLDSFLAAE